jgi:hypothetical protein
MNRLEKERFIGCEEEIHPLRNKQSKSASEAATFWDDGKNHLGTIYRKSVTENPGNCGEPAMVGSATPSQFMVLDQLNAKSFKLHRSRSQALGGILLPSVACGFGFLRRRSWKEKLSCVSDSLIASDCNFS